MPRSKALKEDDPYYKKSIAFLRREAIAAAKDLGYDEKYFARIKKANSENEISQIMATAREEFWRSDRGKAAMKYPDFKNAGKDQVHGHKWHKRKEIKDD